MPQENRETPGAATPGATRVEELTSLLNQIDTDRSQKSRFPGHIWTGNDKNFLQIFDYRPFYSSNLLINSKKDRQRFDGHI